MVFTCTNTRSTLPRTGRNRAVPRDLSHLTPKQREVVALIAEGLSNPQIAERLGISEDGVKTRLRVIYKNTPELNVADTQYQKRELLGQWWRLAQRGRR